MAAELQKMIALNLDLTRENADLKLEVECAHRMSLSQRYWHLEKMFAEFEMVMM